MEENVEVTEEKKRTRKSKREAIQNKINKCNERIAFLQKRLKDEEKELDKYTKQLELMDNEELRKAQELEQKRIAKFIKDKGLTLAQLEELLAK